MQSHELEQHSRSTAYRARSVLPRVRRFCSAIATSAALATSPVALGAQGYYDLDGGRPNRIEDATPSSRHELNLQLLPLRFEQLASGGQRWRSDTKVSYGIAPLTEVEVRVPVLVVVPRVTGAPVTTGVGGVAVGALRALNVETQALPALAVAGEFVIPVGGLAATFGSYSVKGLVTRTFSRLRLHANAGFGTWSVRRAPPAAPSCPATVPPGTPPPPGCGNYQPIVPDTPCDRVPSGGASFACLSRATTLDEATLSSTSTRADTIDGRLVGSRYMAGLGVDHTFALSSTLVSADIVVERYRHLYRDADLVAELGLRRQWTPQLVLDFGVGRHFSGPVRSNTVTLGLSYAMPFGTSESGRRAHRRSGDRHAEQ